MNAILIKNIIEFLSNTVLLTKNTALMNDISLNEILKRHRISFVFSVKVAYKTG